MFLIKRTTLVSLLNLLKTFNEYAKSIKFKCYRYEWYYNGMLLLLFKLLKNQISCYKRIRYKILALRINSKCINTVSIPHIFYKPKILQLKPPMKCSFPHWYLQYIRTNRFKLNSINNFNKSFRYLCVLWFFFIGIFFLEGSL